jgi:hypothetical protein
MKKSIIAVILTLAMVAFGAQAYAGGTFADASGGGYANDPDSSYSATGWWGNYNDDAVANANGGGYFDVYAETTGRHFSYADVDGIAQGFADTCTYAYDFGKTSMAGASSEIDGWAFAEGETLGGFWSVDSKIFGETGFAGVISQSNQAGETGYAFGSLITAGNASMVEFDNSRGFYDGCEFLGYNYESGYTEGFAGTQGRTQVSIDNTGNHRSVAGFTETRSMFDTNHKGDSSSAYMQGNGGIGGRIENQYGASAGGRAHFNYSGWTDGAAGAAQLNAQIHKTSYSTTVTVNAGSSASVID